jgi:hypothetical protein
MTTPRIPVNRTGHYRIGSRFEQISSCSGRREMMTSMEGLEPPTLRTGI